MWSLWPMAGPLERCFRQVWRVTHAELAIRISVGLPPNINRRDEGNVTLNSRTASAERHDDTRKTDIVRLTFAVVLSALILIGMFGALPAQAQGLPSTVEGLGEIPRVVPPRREGGIPAIEVPTARSTVPPGADEILLTPTSIDITGATALSDQQVRDLTAPYIGEEVTLGSLYQLAAEVQAHYRGRGYLLTRAIIPAQRIEDGAFRIEVIEGYIEDVFVVGDIGPTMWQVERYVRRLTRLRPVRTQDIERYLLLANDLPGIQAVAVIRPGTTGPGAAQLVVEVERDPFDGFVSTNNHGSNFAGPWAAAIGLGANGFAPYGDRTEIIYYRTLDSREDTATSDEIAMEQWYGQVSYQGQIWDEGLRLALNATQTLSHPGYTLARLNIKTRTDRYSATLTYPFMRTRARNITGSLAMTHSMERSTISGTPIGRDRHTVLEAELGIDFQDVIPDWLIPFDFLTASDSHVDIGIRQGLPFFGATADNNTFRSRLEGTSQYTAVYGRVERSQGLFNRLDLFMAVAGQYSFDTLLSSQEFRVGGDEFGRGYDPSEISGEHGVGVMLELRYQDRPNFGWLEGYEAYTFFDFGAVWNDDVGFPDYQDLASAGLGARTELAGDVFFDLELARTLTKPLGSRADSEDTWRLLARSTWQF